MTLAELSLFYKNLAELFSAGISFTQVFQTLQANEKDAAQKAKLNFVREQAAKGKSLAAAIERAALVPTADNSLLRAGETAGNLGLIFENLSKYYAQAAQAEKNIRSGLLKPFLTLAAALFVPSFPDLFLGKITLARYALQSFGILAVVMVVVYALYRVYMMSLYDLNLARLRHQIFSAVPFLSGLSKKAALEKFVSGLAMMLNSGINISEAVLDAGRCSADNAIEQAAARISRRIQSGTPLPQCFQAEPVFPAEIQNNILLGNESGKIPAFLDRSASKLKAEVTESVEKISRAVPLALYWIVTLYVAWTILSFYRGHLKELDNVLIEG
jgi:type IV pilus assembly protein PilC